MQNDANFCPECGAAAPPPSTGHAQILESGAPVLTLRPVFVPWAAILSVLPVHIFLTIWGGGFFGGFSMFAVSALGLDLPGWSTFVFFGALFFCTVPLIVYTARKKTYAKTEYTFYRTKLDYYEGFFTTEEKSIDYKHITEVNLVRGIVQKKHGLGTIVLSTPATGAVQGTARSGIRIQDIPDAERVYRRVKELIDRASRQRAA